MILVHNSNIFSAGNTAFSNPGNSDVVVGIDG